MKKGKLGFTLIEVAIFLAISGILFLGITIGVQNSVYQQRKNDSVQSFIEFLRGVYSEVENVQNDVPEGRSEKAIYGKLVTFGEKTDLSGRPSSDKKQIYTYTVIGSIGGTATGDALSILSGLNASVFTNGEYAGFASSYTPKWGAQIEGVCQGACSYKPLEAALLVIRHPNSGAIYTYYKTGTINVNDIISNNESNNPLDDLANMGFSPQQIDFCVNPSGEKNATDRVDIRILDRARNASSIEQVPQDTDDNKCRST